MCFSAFALWFSDVGVQYPDWLNMNVWLRESWSGGDCMCSVCGHHLLLTCLCVIFLSEPEFLTAKPGLRPPPTMTKHKTRIVVVFYSAHWSWKKIKTELHYKGKTKRPSTGLNCQLDPLWWRLSTGLVSHSWVVAWQGFIIRISVLTSQRTPKQDGLQRRVSLHETNWLNICVLADERESRFLKVSQCSPLPKIGETCSWSYSPFFDLSPAVEAVIC